MEFGVELLPEMNYRKLIDFGKLVEENDFDKIWVADHFNNRNIYSVLSLLADRTNEVSIGPGVTNPYVIHPVESASAIQTINEVSDGRAVFGVGAGDKFTLNKIGLSWDKPLTRIKEAIEIIRDLTSGETIDYRGEFFSTNSAKLSFGEDLPHIPIYLGAQGPNMLELGGEVADGVLINASHPNDIEFGLEKINKSDGDTTVMAHTLFSIGEDADVAREKAKEIIPYVMSSVPNRVLKRHDISIEKTKKIKEAISKGKKTKKFINEKMVDTFSISGDVDDCIKKIKELQDLGVDGVVLGSPIGLNKVDAIKLVGSQIIPMFD